MRKYIGRLLVLLMLSILYFTLPVYAEEAETETGGQIEFSELGYTVKNPGNWDGVKGSLEISPVSLTPISDDPELYAAWLLYIPMTAEELESVGDPEAALEKTTARGILFTIKGDRELLTDELKNWGLEEQVTGEKAETNLVQVGEADAYQFFVLNASDEEYAASLDEAYAEEYDNLPALFTKELEQAEYYAPIDPMKALVGKTLSFTTTDLDGNTLTSEELFKDNEITMVNVWGTWCGNCVDEMEELAAIQTRLQEKGCGIVGLEWEQVPDEETYQEARDLMSEKGTNYPSVLLPVDNETLSAIEDFPTTIFVDRNGTILTEPIRGAYVDKYEPAIEALLENKSEAGTGTEEAESYTYRVFIKDEEEQPVKEVAVQFCDEKTCSFEETDEDGCAVFEVPEEKEYEIHVLEAPDGYAFDEEEIYSTGETASDTTIVLKKEE